MASYFLLLHFTGVGTRTAAFLAAAIIHPPLSPRSVGQTAGIEGHGRACLIPSTLSPPVCLLGAWIPIPYPNPDLYPTLPYPPGRACLEPLKMRASHFALRWCQRMPRYLDELLDLHGARDSQDMYGAHVLGFRACTLRRDLTHAATRAPASWEMATVEMVQTCRGKCDL